LQAELGGAVSSLDARDQRLWMSSRLYAFAGLATEASGAVKLLAEGFDKPADVQKFIMETFPAEPSFQSALGSFPPGLHELDILWSRYFTLLDKSNASRAHLLSLAQASDWRVTSAAAQKAGEILDKLGHQPEPVLLATGLCQANKLMDEKRSREAMKAFDELEEKAMKADDSDVASRARNRLLTLATRMPLPPERLCRLHAAMTAAGASKADCGIAALQAALAFERRRKFGEAKAWLGRAPGTAISESGRADMLRRWEQMEDDLKVPRSQP